MDSVACACAPVENPSISGRQSSRAGRLRRSRRTTERTTGNLLLGGGGGVCAVRCLPSPCLISPQASDLTALRTRLSMPAALRPGLSVTDHSWWFIVCSSLIECPGFQSRCAGRPVRARPARYIHCGRFKWRCQAVPGYLRGIISHHSGPGNEKPVLQAGFVRILLTVVHFFTGSATFLFRLRRSRAVLSWAAGRCGSRDSACSKLARACSRRPR